MDNNFKPLDLNKGTVANIFNKCIYTSESKNHTAAIFQQASLGYPKDSDPVLFDKDAIEANSDLINFIIPYLSCPVYCMFVHKNSLKGERDGM